MIYKIVPISKLDPHPDNPNKHPRENIDEIAKSIELFGYIDPIICRGTENERYQILAGEGRYLAVKALGLSDVPIIDSNLPDDLGRAYMIASNEIPKSSELDAQTFAKNIQLLQEYDPTFEWKAIGLSQHEAEAILNFTVNDLVHDGEGDHPEDLSEGIDDKPKKKSVRFTDDQYLIIQQTIDKIRTDENNPKLPEAEAIVLVCADWLS